MANSQTTGAIGGAAQGASIGSSFGPWGVAIGGALGAISGFLGGGGEDLAKQLARIQADAIERTGQETTRRMTRELAQGVGTIRAQIGASNIRFGGSALRYMNEFEAEGLRRLSWEKRRTKMEADAARLGGQIAASQIQSLGMSNMVASLGSAASTGLFGTYTKEDGYIGPGWLG